MPFGEFPFQLRHQIEQTFAQRFGVFGRLPGSIGTVDLDYPETRLRPNEIRIYSRCSVGKKRLSGPFPLGCEARVQSPPLSPSNFVQPVAVHLDLGN
jgi:hypothetical protein